MTADLTDLTDLWLVFFGTRAEVVKAADVDGARKVWMDRYFGGLASRGHLAPPLPEEVAVRAFTAADLERFTDIDPDFAKRLKKA